MVTNDKNPKYWHTQHCQHCGSEFESLISRAQKFCNGKCSSQYTANDVDRLSKIQQTKLERYGNGSFVNPNKAKSTCIKKYGVDNVSKSDHVKKKIKQSCIDHYGTDSYFKTDEFKQHIKDKFGVDNMSQLESTKKAVKDTVNERYGVDNVFASDEIKQKICNYYTNNYGVTHPSQVREIQDRKHQSYKKSFYNKLQTVHKLNLKVVPLFEFDEYITTDRRNHYKFKCLRCDCEFKDHIDGGHLPRCLNCYPLNKGSVCENEIVEFLEEIMPPNQLTQHRRDVIKDRELDIYIENKKIAIEYNSLYYHSYSSVDKLYHLQKTELCEEMGVQLIHIFEDEWINKKDVIKEKLRHKLGCVNYKIYARKCIIKEISPNTKRDFLESHHIQGNDKSSIRYGAYYNDELVAVMTFGSGRISLGSHPSPSEFELMRFATKTNIIGIASKLFKHFIRTNSPNTVVTYADRRFTAVHQSVYDKMGFVFSHLTQVNYWYYKNGYNIRHHRFNFRKSILHKKLKVFHTELSEYENMQLNGYDKIYDCGNIKYIWRSYNRNL